MRPAFPNHLDGISARVAIVFALLVAGPSSGADAITNVMSQVASYQYAEDFTSEVLTNGGLSSPYVSYQYSENFTSEALTNGGISSAIVSYQYFEWPGDDVLHLLSSPDVSYFYLTGSGQAQVVIQGRVVDANGAGIPGTTVSATVRLIMLAQTTSDAGGYYQLPPLNSGNYMLQATAAAYGSSSRILTLNPNTVWQDFQLAPLPTPPTAQETTRQAPTAFAQPPVGPMGSTLNIFNGTAFVNVDANNEPSRSLMTIVLTHGWTQDPLCVENNGIRGWPTEMAATLRANGVTPDQANILGWDWFQAAHPCPFPPEENTPSQGLALGQALQVALGANYSHPVHFLGHSLGTMVNASAANYLHGDLTAQQGVSPTPWSWHQTHMTLFDQAELSRVVSAQVLFDGLTVDPADPMATLRYAADTLQGWKPSMPVNCVWADNYISYVGFYLPNTFNVALQKAAGVWGFNPDQAHGYPMVWYDLSIQTPTDAVAGFQQSREYDLEAGLSEPAFPSDLLQLGDAYHQTPASSDPLALEQLPPEDVFQAIVPFFGNKADIVVQGAVGVVQFAGDVTTDVLDGAEVAGRYVSQGFAYMGNVAAQGGQAVVNIFDSAVLRLTFHTGPSHSYAGPRPLDLTPAPMAWLPVSVPPGSPVMAFDFTVQGDPVDDVLVCGIGETNLFSLEAKYVPTNAVSASRLIDVSAWSGQQVELFFGLMGGTSSNATLQVDNIRFYSLQAPRLDIALSAGALLLSWPASAGGCALQTSATLDPLAWETVTNLPAICADRYLLTNNWSDHTRFFRLAPRF